MFRKALNKNHYFLYPSLLAILLVSSAIAGGGFPDKLFANKGRVTSGLPSSEDSARDAAVQADGKIVVVGSILASGTGMGYDFYIARYNPNGTIDTTFGNNGQKVVQIGTVHSSESATSVAIQADGKILVAGSAQVPATVTEFAVVRLFPSGELDPTFGQSGIKLVGMSNTGSGANGMALQTIDGQQKIVLAGFTHGQTTPVMAFARLDSAGQLDQSFGNAGIKLVPSTSPMEFAYDVAIQNIAGENKIVAAGFSRFSLGNGSYRDDFAVVRLNSNGAMDATFATEGKVRTQMTGSAGARSVVIQQTGPNQARIVAGGYAFRGVANDFALVGYSLTGGLDPTFSADASARVYLDIDGREEQIQSLLVQPDGKLIGVGWTRNLPVTTGQDFALARFNANGTLDKSFGSCGRTVTDMGSKSDIGWGGTLQPDGKILVVGEYLATETTHDIVLARYGIAGGGASALASDFDGDSREDISVFRPSSGTWYMNCSCEGTVKIMQFGSQDDVPVAADYDGDGYTDQAVFRNGMWYVNRSSTGTFSVVSFGLAGDIPTAGDYDGDGVADISVWRPSSGVWYSLNSANGEYNARNFGVEGDKPVQADYDQDGKTDLAVYRDGIWWISKSSEPGGNYYAYQFGTATDVPVKGDFDGDRKADLVVYRAAEGMWHQLLSRDGYKIARFGSPQDVPVPADYTGDGRTEIAVFRSGLWYIQTNPNGAYSITSFGLADDIPTVLK